jgi:hypothetical protein
MLLVCSFVILVTVGFVLPCMLDITMTPDHEFTLLSKGTWLIIAGAFWIFGAAAWLIAGRPRRSSLRHRIGRYSRSGPGPAEALLRHPAAQAAYGYADAGVMYAVPRAPLGPDDDPEFLLELERRIREAREGL